MKKGKVSQPRTSFKQKISLILLGLFLFFVLLEVGIRLSGFISLSLQEIKNRAVLKQKGSYRIMCLGESTTQNQYPPFLERALNQRNIGIKFSVIDKGIAGTTTLNLLEQIDHNINNYHPDMILAMMGINDRGEYISFEVVNTSRILSLFKPFRTYNLVRLLWLHILAKVKEIGFCKLNEEKKRSGEARIYLSGIGLKETYTELVSDKDSLNQNAEIYYKNYLTYLRLGKRYQDQSKFSQAEEAFKKAIELNPKNEDAYFELGRIYQDQVKFSQAEETFKKAIDFNPKSYHSYGAILVLYEDMGKPELVKEYARKANAVRSGHYNPETVNNYLKLKKILDKKGIRLVCVQYPMLSIKPLQKIFEGVEEGLIFIDNEIIFRDAVKKNGYKEYFSDIFGGDFGHCTEKGNRLLAKNIADVILKEVFNK